MWTKYKITNTIAFQSNTEFPERKTVIRVRYNKMNIVSLVIIHQSTFVKGSAIK